MCVTKFLGGLDNMRCAGSGGGACHVPGMQAVNRVSLVLFFFSLT